MKKKLLTESQMRRMAAIAGIPALGGIVGRLSEKLDIQAEQEELDAKEEVVNEQEELEMDAEAEVEMEPEMEEPAGEEVSQDKIESLVDAVLAAIESETGVPAERVDSEEEAPAEEPEMEVDADIAMDAEEPEMEMDAEEEMMETTEPTLAERIAQAVQSVIDEDAAVAEGCDVDEDEEQIEESAEEAEEEAEDEAEAQLDEITKAVVARLRSLK
jgi:pilus assembly protein FimV